MKIGINDGDLTITHSTKKLLRTTFGQLCGLDQQVSFLLRTRYGPRVIIGGAELTGVHILQDQPKPPGVSPYHIGGCGLLLEESLIRAIGETIERYSQLVAEISRRQEIVLASYEQISNGSGRAVSAGILRVFSDNQYARPDFPFRPATVQEPLAWVKATSLIDGLGIWAPAEMTLLGYVAKNDLGKRRIAPAVTTGSAAHTRPELALRNALLELIQIDSAIGHWYTHWPSHRIEHDSRTKAVLELIEKHFHPLGPEVSFFWLPSPDLPGLTVACLIRQRGGYFPAVAIGLGMDLRLNRAMYKAVLEAVGVSGLSKVSLLDACVDPIKDTWKQPDHDTQHMFDLDANVVYFGFAENAGRVYSKFPEADSVRASDLPADMCLDPREEVRLLIRAFQKTQKELVVLDLTTSEIRQLGFTALRAWSPDMLSLPLPSAPPLNHHRFRAYGGVIHDGPHPYA